MGLLRNTQLPDTLAWERVLREPLLAMVPANHPLARQPSVSLAALAREPSSFSTRTSALACMTTSSLAAPLRHTPKIAQEVGEAMTIIGLVAAGLGVSILPASFQRVQLSEMRWLPIDEQDAVSEMWLVWSKHHEPRGTGKTLS
ncbi:LysR family transcriptional regulator YnfL [Klebsiella pneumoniae]|uniref:LysR family transcriptional regulator YnfL n=1 Tax=Klebsiella pneumoniae TaxID=573 RepID=A0A2X3CBB6_KLEPN|nr:LysR family transcriptional regulator YnfL [Klebsiella pneumoniae]